MMLSFNTLVDLQLHGVSGPFLEPGRRGGAGPSGTRAFMLEGHCVMLPVGSRSGAFSLQNSGGEYRLCGSGVSLCTSLVSRPRFYELATADGISYKKIALLHGRDCLASTVVQQCSRYARPETRCRFCALGESLESGATILRKTPEQLAEVAEAARRLDGVSHVTLTSGTAVHRDSGILYLGQCAKAVTERSGLPVQIQFEPPEDFALFDELYALGVANASMHVESLDESVRRKMTPGKATISLDRYFAAFERAVKIFGRNRVSTYVILGLGEDRALTLQRTRELVRMGVYPNLVPLHPLPGTFMAEAPEPDEGYLADIYTKVGEALRREHLTRAGNLAGCGHCGACSLLQYTEESEPAGLQQRRAADPIFSPADSVTHNVSLAVALTPEDRCFCHAIRHEVFCNEQGIFAGDDSDRRDANAVHILAKVNGKAAGTVRCFCRRNGVWVGGRLAVLRDYRGHLGALLVRKAVEIMEHRPDVRRFFAIVQVQNVRFFKLLRWKTLGRPFLCNGVEHQVMEKPLKRGGLA